jgi:hypothetical protein
MTKERYEAMWKLRHAEAGLAFEIDCFGEELAKREGYKNYDGIEAVYLYLILKHHWPPSQVRALNWEDLHLLLNEEMRGWTLPKEARALFPARP